MNALLASHLVATQFPEWKSLSVHPLRPVGWDHRSFRLGSEMVIRMPSSEAYAPQVEKEHEWLPFFKPLLPLTIPEPIAMGKPAEVYPWKWSIYRWIEGDVVGMAPIADWDGFAATLAHFLLTFQNLDSAGGPPPGAHNFYRGGALSTYDAETRRAIARLRKQADIEVATQIWETALSSSWKNAPVWVHGDISASNLLLEEGQLKAVIDFGLMAVGDPACDLAIAWTILDRDSREVFRSTLSLDQETWDRGRGWALWKALVVSTGIARAPGKEFTRSCYVVNAMLSEK